MIAESITNLLARHPGRACMTCSFQAEDVAVVDGLRRVRPDIDVLFLDTGYHFAETYEYRDRLAREWNLHLVNLSAGAPKDGLFRTSPTECCRIRKVEPLLKALEGYDVWFTGLRREQSPTRAQLEIEELHTLPSGKQIAKLNPLAFWTMKDVWSYLRANEIEYLPLYDRGYTSIGCEPCTTVPAPGADARSGRWGGAKLECGIHTFDQR